MSEQLPFTEFLNRLFGGAANVLLDALRVRHDVAAPITNYVAMQILVVALLILVFAIVRARLSVDKPGGLQHMFEGLEGFISGQSHEIIGHHSEGFTPFLVALGVFILTSNLLGLVPAFEAPTATPSVPLGCAIVAFFYYNFQGIKRQGGLAYAKHFMGPMWWLAPLMFPIEIISHLARPLSLTVRLYANMFAGEQVTLVFLKLTYFIGPVIFMGLHVFVGVIQAYIFMLLAMVYVGGAVAHDH